MAKIVLDDDSTNLDPLVFNENFRKIEEEFNAKVLYRDNPNGEPNEMQNDLDMNGNRIYNLPKPVEGHEPLRLVDIGFLPEEIKEYAEESKEWAEKAQDSYEHTLEALAAGSVYIGDYGPGLVIEEYTNFFGRDGIWWRPSPDLGLPYTTTGDWGDEEGLFVAVGDQALRQDLANYTNPNAGAAIVARAVVTVDTMLQLLNQPARTDLAFMVTSFHAPWAGSIPGHVGGGEFRWDASRPKSDHNGGTIISPTVPWDGSQAGLADFLDGVGETDPSGSGCFVRVCDTTFDPTWFGARPNAAVSYTYDDTKSFQACLAAIYKLGQRGGRVTMPTANYVINGQLDIIVSQVSIDFNRSFFRCENAPAGTTILYVTGDLDNYKQDHQNISCIQNLVLMGNYAGAQAGTFTADALVFEQPNVSDPSGPAFLRINGIAVDGFRNGAEIRSNSYLLRFTDVQIGGCVNGLHLPSGYSNTGEAITFRNSVFLANKTDARVASISADVYFDTCSFDFTNGTWLDVSNKARVDCYGCHFEQTDYDDYLFKIDSQGSVQVFGGFVYVQSGSAQHTHLIRNDVLADNDGGITFDGTWFNGVEPTYRALSTGEGRTILKNTRGVTFSYLTSRNPRSNKLPDGGFEFSPLRGLISISYDTGITDQWTGDNFNLTSSTAQARTGTRSLRVNKNGSTVSDRSFFIAVPVDSERVHSSFWIKPGTYTGNLQVEYGFGNVVRGTNKLDALYFTRDASYTTRTIDLGALSDWTEYYGMTRPTPSPAWATHHVIVFRMTTAMAGDFFIDDFTINTL